MSVSYANALAKRIDASFLCCTRKEGLLKNQMAPEVGYLFLDKKSAFDPKAFFKLRRFIKENKIDLIQAHSSSWFLALMVKLSLPMLKLVWHDHYGRELNKRNTGILKPASKFFDGIIAVNKDLEAWSKKNLYSKKVRYFKNFLAENSSSGERVRLKGGDSFKIICVANLRPQKDHLNLLQAFHKVMVKRPASTLHLVGTEEQTSYSADIRKFIEENNLQEKVFIYGEQENISEILKQADLGVLSSASEGLPLALLEYGRAGLAVVCTDVGECAEVIGSAGKIVSANNSEELAKGIIFYLRNVEERKRHSADFNEFIFNNFSEKVIVPDLDYFYCELIDCS